MRKIKRPTKLVFAATITALVVMPLFLQTIRGSEPVFTFGAAGDFAETTNTDATLTRLAASGLDFFLALGDLSYKGIIGTEPQWCSLVTSKVGETYPFELLAGNHEDNGPNGLIDNYVQCLPNRLGTLIGTYGKEYYFDYPADNPIARFILISPGLSFTYGGTYKYAVANSHYRWLANAIDGARANGTPWVIVGMHEFCLSIGGGSCDVGQDLIDLLVAKKVDLVIQGHSHTYQRTKQLACAIRNFYVGECVADDGSDHTYAKGNGTVFIVMGTAGQSLVTVSTTDSELPYFAAGMGSNTPGYGYGFGGFTVSESFLRMETSFSGTFSDAFTITK